jgi:hypothetical protein
VPVADTRKTVPSTDGFGVTNVTDRALIGPRDTGAATGVGDGVLDSPEQVMLTATSATTTASRPAERPGDTSWEAVTTGKNSRGGIGRAEAADGIDLYTVGRSALTRI